MEIESKQEKIKFLEDIKGIAESNLLTIGKSGVQIFDADCRQYEEECGIGIKIDENGKAYFTIHGTYAENSSRIDSPENLLIAGDRYLPNNFDKFKGEFHLYKDYTNQIFENDLINSLRN